MPDEAPQEGGNATPFAKHPKKGWRGAPIDQVPKLLHERPPRNADVRVTLNRTEAHMLALINKHYDVPYTVLMRLIIREKYNDLYGDQPPEIDAGVE